MCLTSFLVRFLSPLPPSAHLSSLRKSGFQTGDFLCWSALLCLLRVLQLSHSAQTHSMKLSRTEHFLYFFLFFSIIHDVFAQQCWYPDGHTLTEDIPCKETTSGFSACCGFNRDGSRAYCLSNGLCWADMALHRGSCTDKGWKSDACANYCTSSGKLPRS